MHISEKISALLDNAGDRSDEDALAEIARDPAARRTWARYQMIGDSLRDAAGPLTTLDFGERVAAVIERASLVPPAPTEAAILRPYRWRSRPALGLAAAASVAALLFSGWYSRPPPVAPTPLVAQEMDAPVRALAATPESNSDAQRVSVLSEEEYQRRINSYLVNFNEQRTQLGVPGVHPYVRVVGFESAPEQ